MAPSFARAQEINSPKYGPENSGIGSGAKEVEGHDGFGGAYFADTAYPAFGDPADPSRAASMIEPAAGDAGSGKDKNGPAAAPDAAVNPPQKQAR